MPKFITVEQYYMLVGHYIVASQAQDEVRNQEKSISAIVEIPSLTENISDAIYNPEFKGKKSELDDMLLKGGIMVKWQEPKNKFAKQQEKESEDNVSG